MANVEPLDDRIIIKQIDAEDTTAGGIVLPDSAKEKPQQAEIVAVGNGRLSDEGNRIPVQVNVGDVVIFGKYSGDEIKVSGDDLKIIRESDILAIVE
ncbi:MAG: co-chaperone GroES [Planctomycetota bacterium]|jgi:chaperonin GroES|nr:co-chaperone GroES [Planctomycetota bacterium]MDP6354790.1 co-chaperone GroES [Planctomycetota bacterium]MDP6503071.1 co-chaperone GroES [Planctomycetota bacterium]MDP7129093.1 co-chaperone GroES [Planctomycetota bacterium]MDP7248375.1 co-chaperone GroES [Planctomycetota bacterium]